MSVFDENIITEEYLRSRGFKPYYSTDRCCDYYGRTILEKKGESNFYLPKAFIHYYPKNLSMTIEKKQGDFWIESFYHNLTNTIDLEMIMENIMKL